MSDAPARSFEVIPFHNTTLEAFRDDAGVWASLRRMCEALGVDLRSQLKKIEAKAWAEGNVVLKTTMDASGRNFEMACLHLDAVPIWLATIEASRVAERVRPTLVLFQRECARVLRDHFFGRDPVAPTEVIPAGGSPVALFEQAVNALKYLEQRTNEIDAKKANIEEVKRLEAATERKADRLEVEAIKTEVRGLKTGLSSREFKALRLTVAAGFDGALVSYCSSQAQGEAYVPFYRECCRRLNTVTRAKRRNWRFDHFHAAARFAETTWRADMSKFWEAWALLPKSFIRGQLEIDGGESEVRL